MNKWYHSSDELEDREVMLDEWTLYHISNVEMCPICEVCVWISTVQTDWSWSVTVWFVKLHDDMCCSFEVPLHE